jgi:hypothetical protein
MIQMHMRDEYRWWRLSVAGQKSAQRFGAAVHHQQRSSIAFKDHARRAEFRCGGIAHAEEMQAPVGSIGGRVWHG